MLSSISNRISGLFRVNEQLEHPHGKSITIHSILNDTVQNDFRAIEKLLNHPDVRNRKIVLFSIIGAYRRGKSFFLDYCLRYLYANYKSINYPDNPCNTNPWVGGKDEPLSGFSWKSGVERNTTGIVIWNDIFFHTVESTGEKLAIVVMDTQGLFDNETTPMENSRIFALSTLISSIQILNLSNLIQEDQLQYLQFATEFAKFASADCNSRVGKPFQNLMVLLRDWSNSDQYDFGIEGGQKYLNHILTIKPDQKAELTSVRQFIHDSFEKVGCALLPHPGKQATGGTRRNELKFDGRWSQVDADFKEEMEKLIEFVLAPQNLVAKKINGIAVKCSDFKKYMMNYFTLFASDELPQTQSIYESTVENHMNLLVTNCLQTYKKTVYRNEDLITTVNMINIVNDIGKKEALIDFNDARKMGNAEHEEKFKKILCDKIDDLFQLWSENSEKNIEKLVEERKKLQLALEEQQRLEKEQMEAEREASERLAVLEAENAKNLRKAFEDLQKVRINAEKDLQELEDKYEEAKKNNDESAEEERQAMQIELINHSVKELEQKYEMERQIAELRLKFEQAEVAKIRAERKREAAVNQEIARKRTLADEKKDIENCIIL